ncbi:hypothetical protein LWI29_018628 [Acer saccharum]|uniref:RPW8 domain-containing protein n=1 Tax=Acer saccharum TaxID=4024 RepID=A0AA39TFF5_ACESA|nr:hypothetical protein LWI29_018628 [Acer saccharum]
MAELIAGAMLGAVFGELLKVVIEAKNKSQEYESELEKLKSTLESITPIIQEIETLNNALNIPKQETTKLKEELIEGTKLVRKCNEVKCCCFKKVNYADKLNNLNQSIERFIKVNMQTQMARDGKKTLEGVNTALNILTGYEKGRVEIEGLCSVPEPPEITPGLDDSLKELRKELVKDNGMQVIVITAPGGAGKTTLIKKLCADEKVKDKFQENIFFVTVSKTPDVKVIVKRILQHMKREVPMFQTEEAAINDLERLLKSFGQKAILLVLDDVWSELLVQKFKFKLPNYKILVTSRSVFPQFGSGYQLKPLNDEAAMSLFRSSVTPQDGKLSFHEDLAKKILRFCKGSPLALTVVGKFLCGQPAAVCKEKLRNGSKECYLDLGSFLQDQWIPITALIDMWMELHEWVEDDLSAINYLHKLSNRNLINRLTARKNASDDHYIMHHDLLRDMIIHQSMSEPIEQTKRVIVEISGNQFPKWWSEKKQNPIHARLLSISTDETFSSGWYELKAPEVEVVVLNLRTNKYTSPNFMGNMGKLKVVIVLNYGFLPAELSNFSLLGSDIFEIDYCNDLLELPDELCDIVSLKKLNITECFKLSTLPEEIGKLVKLEELRLASCTALKELPEMVTELSMLKLLDISGCLSITKLPTKIGKLCSLEMLGMRGCSSFELPQSIENLERLKLVK